jgi:hypothetical protein
MTEHEIKDGYCVRCTLSHGDIVTKNYPCIRVYEYYHKPKPAGECVRKKPEPEPTEPDKPVIVGSPNPFGVSDLHGLYAIHQQCRMIQKAMREFYGFPEPKPPENLPNLGK